MEGSDQAEGEKRCYTRSWQGGLDWEIPVTFSCSLIDTEDYPVIILKHSLKRESH